MRILFYGTKTYDKIWFEPMAKKYGYEIHFLEAAASLDTIKLSEKVSLLAILVLLNVRNRVSQKLVRDSSSVNVNLICESLTSRAKRLVSKLSGFFLYADIQRDYLVIE